MTRKKRSTSHEENALYFFLFFVLKTNVFLHFDLGIVLTTLKMTLNPQNNTINGFSKEVLHIFLTLLVKHDIFAYLTLELTF